MRVQTGFEGDVTYKTTMHVFEAWAMAASWVVGSVIGSRRDGDEDEDEDIV